MRYHTLSAATSNSHEHNEEKIPSPVKGSTTLAASPTKSRFSRAGGSEGRVSGVIVRQLCVDGRLKYCAAQACSGRIDFGFPTRQRLSSESFTGACPE